jgi:hypothetical protein
MMKSSSRVLATSRSTLPPLSSAFARAAGEGAEALDEVSSFEVSEDLDPRWRSSDSDIVTALSLRD